MADEDDHEKTQIFLRPGNSAAAAPPKPEEKAHEVVLKPARKAADTTQTAVDFDITGEHHATGAATKPAAKPAVAPSKSSALGLIVGAVAAVIVAVAAFVLLR